MNYSLAALGPYALAIIAGLFVHACYALSLSMLTLINSNAIGSAAKHSTVLKLSLSYIIGSIFTTLGILAVITYLLTDLVAIQEHGTIWVIVSFLAVIVGLLTILFYYRPGKGTKLWLPRTTIERVSLRAKKTNAPIEAFGLGIMMVIFELPFLIAPFVITAAVLGTLPQLERGIGMVAYAVAATMPLIIVTIMIGGGYKLSTIQRWRESNKTFLQWTSGSALVLLGIYLFAINVWGVAS